MAASDATKKLKILCLHGYRSGVYFLDVHERRKAKSSKQNAQSFRERTGAFRKIPIVKKHTDLVFISAPNRVPPLSDAEGGDASSNEGQQGWWFSQQDDTYKAQDYTDCCKGYDESLEVIKKSFQEEDDTYKAQDYTDCCKGYDESLEVIKKSFQDQGPFDGILSFSQGAAMVTLLCGLKEQKLEPALQFDFVILVAGFQSRQSQHDHLYKVPFSVPSLHVYGDTDKVIQKEMSEELLPYFVDPSTLQHEGGHFIPTGGPQKKIYTEFLQKMIDHKYS